MKKEKKSETLAAFLKFIKECEDEYATAFDEVGKEDRRLQDLLHELEFAPNAKERNKIATKLRNSRKKRRQAKDIVQENEEIVGYFKKYDKYTNGMREMLGRQRKKEEYVFGERTYRTRESEELTIDVRSKITAAFANAKSDI